MNIADTLDQVPVWMLATLTTALVLFVFMMIPIVYGPEVTTPYDSGYYDGYMDGVEQTVKHRIQK
jgi:hypothetical protein